MTVLQWLTKSLRNLLGDLWQHREQIGYVFLSSLLFLFVYRNLQLGKMFAYADLPPFPTSSNLLLNRFTSVWQNEHLGFPLPEISFQVIVEAVILLFGDPNVAQKILLLSAMPCAMISMYIFVSRFVKSNPSRFLGSALYGLNPVIIGRFVNGGPLDVLFLYALLPLLWLQLTRIIDRGKILDVLLFSLLFGIVGSRLYAIFWAIVPFTFMLILVELWQRRYREKSFFTGIALIMLSFSIGLLLVLPDILLAFQRNGTLVSQSETFIEAIDWAYSTPNPLNLMWLAGNGGDLMNRSLGYNDITSWTLLGLVVPIIAFSSVFLVRKEKREYVFLFLPLVMAVTIFVLLTRVKLTYPLFNAFPTLFSLKNPVKIMYPMSLGLCSLFGIGLEGITERIEKGAHTILRKRVQGSVFSTLVLVLVLLFLLPAIGEGTVGLSNVYGDSYVVPSEYETVLNWINEHRQSDGYFRTLWLPYDYPTQIRLEATDPENVALRSGAAWLDMPNIDFVRDLFETICKGNMENFSELLTILDVKYVIIDLGSSYTTECQVVNKQVTPWIIGNPIYFKNLMEQQNYLSEVNKIGDLLVYENEKFSSSHFAIYDNPLFLTSPQLNETLANVSPVTPNLLQNSDFEDGLKSWWADKKASIDEQVVIKGGHSARISNNDTERWASMAQTVSVEPGGSYHFSAWIKAQNSKDPHIKLVWYDKNGTSFQTDYIIEKGKIEGTTDWLNITQTIRAPKNAVAVSVRLAGGLAMNMETAAVTWFDSTELYEIPSIPSDSFSQNFLTLANVPGFYSSEQMVIFDQELSHDEISEALNVSNVIAFANPTTNQLKQYANLVRDQKLLLIYEAEALNAPGRRLILDSSMSNGEAIALNESTLTLEFYALASSYYKVGLGDLPGNVSLFLDDIPLSLVNRTESQALYLEKGDHILRLTGENTILDLIEIFSGRSIEDINSFFEIRNSTSDITSTQSGRGHYTIEANSGGSSFLVLGESYDPDWKATIGTENLEHFRAFGWSNAFYVQKTGEIRIEISYAQQPLRDMSINLWGLCWIIILTVFVALMMHKRKNRTIAQLVPQVALGS